MQSISITLGHYPPAPSSRWKARVHQATASAAHPFIKPVPRETQKRKQEIDKRTPNSCFNDIADKLQLVRSDGRKVNAHCQPPRSE